MRTTPTLLDGNTLGPDSQLNLFDGGEVRGFFDIGLRDGTGSNIEFNMFGGSAPTFVDTYAGTTVNIAGGSVVTLTGRLADGSDLDFDLFPRETDGKDLFYPHGPYTKLTVTSRTRRRT